VDLTRTRVVLRERAVLDVLDLALRFVVVHLSSYARAALVVVPLLLASIGLAQAFGWIAAWSFALFSATFAEAPFTVLASRLVFEDEVRVSRALKEALAASPRLLGLRLLRLLGVPLAVLTLGWFALSRWFVVDVALLERASVRAAVARSIRLAMREGVEMAFAMILLFVLHATFVVSIDVGGRAVVSALLESRAPEPMWADGGSVLALLGYWLFVPYGATARFFVYLDVRTRSEGWDIQTRFAALAARPLPEARSAA
jgi:hypothetical protein